VSCAAPAHRVRKCQLRGHFARARPVLCLGNMNRIIASAALLLAAASVLALSAGCTVNQAPSGGADGGSTPPGTTPPGTTPVDLPPGNVPTDLVGTWTGARAAITERMTFNADGSGSWTTSNVTESSGGCLSFVETRRVGNVVITDTTITVHEASLVEGVQTCTPPSVDETKPVATDTIQWHRPDSGDPNMILVIDSVCAAKYPGQENCDTLGCPIALYCTSRLTRE
jgi:hypothetical protein